MVIKEPLKINAAQPDKLKIILPQPLIISNPTSLNKDFYYNYQRQLNYQEPETLNSQQKIGIFPAYQTSPAAEFEEENDFILLSFEPDFLINAVYETINNDSIEIIQKIKACDPLIKQIGLAIKKELEISIFDSRLYVESAANMLAVHLLKNYATRKVIFKVYDSGFA